MKKKIVSVILVAAMAVGCLAGCGSKEAKNEDAFYIGGIGPVTGDAAIYGTAVQNGAQIAVDEINEAGGINGHQIEYNFQDDQGDPEKAANAYNTLKDWGMQVLMGTVTTGPCVSVADYALQTLHREQNPHSISVRITLPRKWQLFTTVQISIHQVSKQNL